MGGGTTRRQYALSRSRATNLVIASVWRCFTRTPRGRHAKLAPLILAAGPVFTSAVSRGGLKGGPAVGYSETPPSGPPGTEAIAAQSAHLHRPMRRVTDLSLYRRILPRQKPSGAVKIKDRDASMSLNRWPRRGPGRTHASWCCQDDLNTICRSIRVRNGGIFHVAHPAARFAMNPRRENFPEQTKISQKDKKTLNWIDIDSN